MRKIILLEHISLDGFAADANNGIGWVRVDEEMFDMVGKITEDADTALYGRKTYEIMENYWPTAKDKPNATKHDIEHSNWANNALKIVFSKTLKKTDWANTRIISEKIVDEMKKLKDQPGKDILLLGSPSIAGFFMQNGLIDEYYICVNPIILGDGIPLFKKTKKIANLKLLEEKTFKSGVVWLHYKSAA